MIIKSIRVSKFKIFKEFFMTLSSINFIRGKNGSGKSTIGKEAHLFCIWGYTDKNLKEYNGKQTSIT